jgi:hypothetical protein
VTVGTSFFFSVVWAKLVISPRDTAHNRRRMTGIEATLFFTVHSM